MQSKYRISNGYGWEETVTDNRSSTVLEVISVCAVRCSINRSLDHRGFFCRCSPLFRWGLITVIKPPTPTFDLHAVHSSFVIIQYDDTFPLCIAQRNIPLGSSAAAKTSPADPCSPRYYGAIRVNDNSNSRISKDVPCIFT